jgi:hypothetical protein
MRRSFVLVCCATVWLLAWSAAGFARQGDEPVLSPPEKASCTFPDGKSIKVDYSSPRMRGRKIFGGLVSYGEVWRAGANEATTFVANTPVMVQQKLVPSGSYTIFTLPTQNKWTFIISKETGEWGIPYPGAKSDFARVDMQVAKLPSRLENFTISFDKAADRCTMRLDWETTRASVDVSEKK